LGEAVGTTQTIAWASSYYRGLTECDRIVDTLSQTLETLGFS
jgi:hypothetical protein